MYETTPFLSAVSFSTDMGGICHQASARNDAVTNPLIYPFIIEEGIEINKQVTGNSRHS